MFAYFFDPQVTLVSLVVSFLAFTVHLISVVAASSVVRITAVNRLEKRSSLKLPILCVDCDVKLTVLVLTELLSLGVTDEALRVNMGSKSAISLQRGRLTQNWR